MTNAKPGDSSSAKCITVTYTGSLSSAVKLYRSSFTGGSGNLDTQVDLAVTKGTGGAFADCSGFTPAATGSNVYSGKLSDFPATSGGGLALTNTVRLQRLGAERRRDLQGSGLAALRHRRQLPEHRHGHPLVHLGVHEQLAQPEPDRHRMR